MADIRNRDSNLWTVDSYTLPALNIRTILPFGETDYKFTGINVRYLIPPLVEGPTTVVRSRLVSLPGDITIGARIYTGSTLIADRSRVDTYLSGSTQPADILFSLAGSENNNGYLAITAPNPSVDTSTLSVEFYVVHPTTGDRHFSPLYRNSMTGQLAASATVLPVISSRLFNTSTLGVNGVHGSLIYGDYVYGSTRYVNYSPTGQLTNLVRVNKNNLNDAKSYSFPTSTGGTVTIIDQIVNVGPIIFGLTTGGLFRFNTENETYKLYTRTGIVSGDNANIICTDGVHIYASHDIGQVSKFLVSDFHESDPTFSTGPAPVAVYNSSTQGGYIDYPKSGYSYSTKGACHSMVVDSTHLYVNYTTNVDYDTAVGKFVNEMHKVRISDMTAAGWTYIPHATDDACQISDWVLLGIEMLSTSYIIGGTAFNKAVCAVKKSDLSVKYLPTAYIDLPAGQTNYKGSLNSFASLVFGDYLLDYKVNGVFYVVDLTDIDNWDEWNNTTLARGANIIGQFKLTSTEAGWPASQDTFPPNEAVFDPATQTFYSFFWPFNNGNARSAIASYQLPGLLFINPPTLSLLSPLLSGLSVTLSATVDDNGGAEIIGYGIEYGLTAETMAEISGCTFEDGVISATITSLNSNTTYYYRVYATNEKSTTYTAVASFVSPVFSFSLSGSVLNNDGTAIQGVKVYLLRISTNQLIASTTTDSSGTYSFGSLVQNADYLVFGHKEVSGAYQRMLPKILKPSIVI